MDFLELYREVFDKDNNVTACGRLKCKRLIELADSIEPEVNHGDVDTCFINIENMINLYNKENKKNG